MRYEDPYILHPEGLLLSMRIRAVGGRQSIVIKGKVDTGADISVIPEELIEKLSLKKSGYIHARGVFDEKPKPRRTFFIITTIGDQDSYRLEVISSHRENCLIGRDLLNQIVLHSNGPANYFMLRKSCSKCEVNI